MAFQNGEDEICLTSFGRTYTIDLTVMKQINEDIGITRSIFRRVNANPTEGKSPTCSSRYKLHLRSFKVTKSFVINIVMLLISVWMLCLR